jgi:hypothetical protein
MTCTAVSDRVFIVLVIVTTVGFIVGIVLLILWLRHRRSVAPVVKIIRKRKPPEGHSETIPNNEDSSPDA